MIADFLKDVRKRANVSTVTAYYEFLGGEILSNVVDREISSSFCPHPIHESHMLNYFRNPLVPVQPVPAPFG